MKLNFKRFLLIGPVAITYFFFMSEGVPVNFVPLKVIVPTIIISILPGFFIYKFIFHSVENSLSNIILVSFVLSFFIWIILGLSKYIFGISLDYIIHVYFLICVISVVMYSSSPTRIPVHPSQKTSQKKNKQKVTENIRISPFPFSKPNRFLQVIFFIAFVIITFVALHYGSWISGDFVIHMSYIRKIYEIPNYTYGNCFFKDLGQYNNSVYGYNIWHIFVAVVSKIAHLDPIEVWAYIGVVLSTLWLLSIYFWGEMITQNKNLGYIVSVTHGLWFGILRISTEADGLVHFPLMSIAYPHAVSFIFLYITIGILFQYLYTIEKKCLPLLTIASSCVAFCHFYSFFQLSFIIVAFALFLFLFKETETVKKLAKGFLCSFLIAGVYSSYMSLMISPVRNPWFMSKILDQFSPVIYICENYPFINPFKPVSILSEPMKIFAYLLMPFLFIDHKKEKWNLYIMSIFITVFVVFINSPLLFFLRKFNPDLQRVYRLEEVVPYFLMIGVFVCGYWKNVSKFALYLTFFGRATLILLLILAYIKKAPYLSSTPYTAQHTLSLYENNKRFMSIVNSIIPPGSVILMNTDMTWYWPVLFPHYLVAHATDTMFPPNFDPRQRREDLSAFLNNPLSQMSFDILDKYKVNYIIVNSGKDKITTYLRDNPHFLPVLKFNHLEIYKYKQ